MRALGALCGAVVVACMCCGVAIADTPRYPNHHAHACLPPNDTFPFCDTTLAVADRVADLISRMTLAEKVSMTYDRGSEVDSIGIPDINWNQEGLHGLGAQCFSLTAGSDIRCPTVFAAPPALASSWNRSLLLAIGDAISTEMRAYNNFGGNRGYQNRPVDLNVWLPNVNIGRDPRWGRQVETYSECPWATGQLGAAIVRGAQHGADGGASGNGFLKAIVAVKHATAYQVETNRFALNENISAHDLADTFYPAWEGVIQDGGAVGFMCSYPSVNGVPMCGNELFETTLMKETWGLGSQTGGGSYVQSDCGAIENIASQFHYAANKTYAAAVALNAGTDVDCGDGFPSQLALAISMGLTTEDTLDASLTRTYTLQFLAGRFDPLEAQPYTAIPFEAIGSAANLALAEDSASQGLVLLRNDAELLPLAVGLKLALTGPFANDSSIAGNYFEDICPDAHGSLNCVPTLLGAVAAFDASSVPSFTPGCAVNSADTSGVAAAVAACAAADICVLALGTDGSIAGEGRDRTTTALPGSQGALAAAVLAANKPTVLVLFNGMTLAIDDIVSTQRLGAPLAIVEGWNPGVAGGTPVAAALFGATNRWGKLPVTWYPQQYFPLLTIEDMDMVHGGGGAGRTYKYYNSTAVGLATNSSGMPLFDFGYGLSYTNFTLSGDCPGVHAAPLRLSSVAAPPPPVTCTVTVRNTGLRAGDEVVQVFFVPAADAVARARAAHRAGGPRKDPLASRLLVAFERVTVVAGGSVDIPFSFPVPSFATVSDAGSRVVYPGDYTLRFTRGHGEDLNIPVRVETRDGESLVLREYPKWW